jgi:hypothetical protein
VALDALVCGAKNTFPKVDQTVVMADVAETFF